MSAGEAGLRVKVATEDWEFRAIHRLNHQAFAEEIPQHAPQASGRLVDRFHDDNTYCIALRGEEVIGMLAVRGTRPFSLDQKLPGLDTYLPEASRPCELRLLTIARAERHGRVLARLFQCLWRHASAEGFDLAVISGTTGQLKMYRSLGFVPFGPLVGSPGAWFQPMFITRAEAEARLGALLGRL
ncbi:MAG TPA: hypothetical protein VMN81_05085 [Vicinamibacterales bacterium]|nr:hypothetical protein [Vicinamibacterales bacterium]